MEQAGTVKQLCEPLYRVKGWIKLVGILMIVSGVLTVLSLWGIIIAWIPIWIGVLLSSASDHVNKAWETDNEQEFQNALQKLAKSIKIFGIYMLVILVLVFVAMAAAIIVPAIARAL